jgi:L-lactate utilization protein LutC
LWAGWRCLSNTQLEIAGPSRTAEVEKILMLGVHGRKRLILLFVD